MNAVNRFLMVVLLFVVMVLCVALFVAPVPMLKAIARQSTTIAEVLEPLKWYQRELPGVVIALIWIFIVVLLLILELRRPALKFIRVEKAAGGEVQVSVVSIADRLRYEVDQLASVLRTKPKVTGRRRGVMIKLDVETVAGINVPQKADLIVETARRVVEEKMGLKLARPPRVNLRAVPYPRASFRKPERPVAPKEEAISGTPSGAPSGAPALAAPVELAEPEEVSPTPLIPEESEGRVEPDEEQELG